MEISTMQTDHNILNQSQLLEKIQQISLTLVDLLEYLDTHSYDSFAISRYDMTKKELNTLTEEYEKKFAVLRPGSGNDPNTWDWAIQPFPWDM